MTLPVHNFSTRIIVLKAVLLVGLLVLYPQVSYNYDGREFREVLLFQLPFLAAILLPPKLCDIASGITIGAIIVLLPFTLIFSVFGGIFPDPKLFIFMRVSAAVLVVFLISAGVAARGEKASRLFPGVATSLIYSLILVATSR